MTIEHWEYEDDEVTKVDSADEEPSPAKQALPMGVMISRFLSANSAREVSSPRPEVETIKARCSN